MPQNITEIIREIAEKSMPSIVVGYIQSVSPLRVVLVEDMNISLSAQSVIVPSNKYPLRAGEQWYLLSVYGNKIYYFLDRV